MADDNWKERLGFEINFNSSEEDERMNGSDELSPLSPVNREGSGELMDAIIRDYDAYGTTPPRTRILRRNRDRNRKEKEGQSVFKSSCKSSSKSSRVVYAGRNSFEKNMYKKSEPPPNDNFDASFSGGDSRRSSNANKRSMQRLRGSERDLKLDLSSIRICPPKEERAESLPPQPVLKVQSCNRFMSLSSKLVACQHFGLSRSHFQPPTTTEECSQSRVEFYQTFSLLIKMGNVEKQGEIPCKRQLSKEENLWQNELKEVIWLELQAWHAGRTLKAQDDYLFEARKNVEQVLLDIISYRFKKRPDQLSAQSSDSGIQIPPVETEFEANSGTPDEEKDVTGSCTSCVSLFCPSCMEHQNCALRDVENLLQRLEAAEGLFPSSKSFAQQYPLYKSPQFIARVKAMCLWYNMTNRHRLKLLILGKHLLCHTEAKIQTWSSSTSSNNSSNTNSDDVTMKMPSPDNTENIFPGYMMTLDYYNTQPITKVAQYFQHLKTVEARVYRKYIEDVLKTRGLRKALNFLEKLHTSVLRKATITLEKPTDEVDIGYPQTGLVLDLPEEAELKRYGFWSPESQALGLPTYRASYLFMSRIPLDIIHEFLRMRLETKPERPSNMSIRQLIRELKEGISLAVVSRERYLCNVETALWDTEPSVLEGFKSQVACFDASVQSILEVYLDYLQQWVQMIQQERVQKNILKEEWTFINKMTPHIPGGQALVGSSFCRMASSMLRAIREQFKDGVDELTENITSEVAKLAKLSICRELQVLCTETREKALSVVALAKTVRKDLENEDSNRTSLCCNIIADSLAQLKREAISMCDYLSNVVVRVDQTIQFLEDWEGRLREVVHQYFKFGFEYHKEVCWVVTGGSRAQLSRGLITFAQHWMVFAKQRCERGRGLRPRWAHHGFDFLMTICEPHFTNCLTDEEFEELKTNIDECISHVIGTAVPSSSGTTTPPTSYYSRSRGVSPSPSPAPRTPKPVRHDRSLSTPPNPEINGYRGDLSAYINDKDTCPIPELEVPILRNLSKSEQVLEAINKLEGCLESRLKSDDLIGNVVIVATHSERNFIRPRPVNFGWQRGIKIGQGRFGKVYTAVNNETGELMAMKEIALQPNDHRTIRSVALELKIFEGIQHKNLVRYYGVEIHREEMLIFMELCTEGTLECLVAATETGLPEALVRRYTHQLVNAVNTLHQHSIVHRDIKSANIFLTAEGNCLKLGDFGSAVKIKAHTTVPGELQGFVGTQAYMAPEVFMKTNQEGHGRAVDVWSLGCVLVEMGSGKRPWADFDSNYQIMFKVGMGEIPAIPENLSEEGRHFASLCLVHDPKERATTSELLNHTFLVVDNDEECLSFAAMPSMLENYLKLGIKR